MDGFFCCQIDSSESSYLTVLLDEIFGRENFVTTLFVKVRYDDKTLKQDSNYHKTIEQVHIYRRSKESKPNRQKSVYDFSKFIYKVVEKTTPEKTITMGGKRVDLFLPEQYEIQKITPSANGLKEIWASGTILDGNSSGRFFRDYLTGRSLVDGLSVLYKVYGIGDDGKDYRYFTGPKREGATKGKYYQGVPIDKTSESLKYSPIPDFYDMSGAFGNCRLEGDAPFRGGKKPEEWIAQILKYFSNENDIVLDSFLGSGTTAAVAHKMGRRWIGIEMGEHAKTHCIPRLEKVIAGEQGGISESVNWQGGGSFTFCELGEPVFDTWGNINPKVTFATLAAYLWQKETRTTTVPRKAPFLGAANGVGIYLLYNGILGDKTPASGNVLTRKLMKSLLTEYPHEGPKIIYADAVVGITPRELEAAEITFKQIPYDVRG